MALDFQQDITTVAYTVKRGTVLIGTIKRISPTAKTFIPVSGVILTPEELQEIINYLTYIN